MQHFRIALALLLAISAAAPVHVQAADAAPALSTGAEPPAYVGRTFDGDDVQLNISAGRAYVITFWASWCGPCLQELPILSNLQKRVSTEQLQVITVNIEDRQIFRKLRGTITELGLIAAYDPNSVARRAFGVKGIPHMVVVGRDGKISAVRTGYSEARLDTYVEDFNRALAAPAPSANKK